MIMDSASQTIKILWVRRFAALFFHGVGIVAAFWFALLLRFDFQWGGLAREAFLNFRLWMVFGFVAGILLFRLDRGFWRFFTLRDCFITGVAIAVGAVFAGVLVYLANDNSFRDFPRSALIITGLLLLGWEVGFRGFIRLIREHRVRRVTPGGPGGVLLMGSPDDGDSLLRNMLRYPQRIGKVQGLVSHTERHRGQQLRGIPIYGVEEDIPELVEKRNVDTVLFLPPLNSPAFIRDTMDAIAKAGLKCNYRVIPSMEDLASGRLDVETVRRVSIEDLLQRPPHTIDLELIRSSIQGRKIMVTGAGGSIGSEICRQILQLEPQSLTMFDSGEYSLFEIDRELHEEAKRREVETFAVAGDVRRADQVRSAIEQAEGIDVIYHAAAYKHVHLMEQNPVVCFQNNVIGTQTVASVAEKAGVGEFVLVSTDKAVRPTSLMGASKRLAERVIIERPRNKTKFKAVRFGNVLGSSGSVIPIFRKQIREGGPVTVTSKEVTRYFMTIPEAVELVIAAGAVSEDRRICVLEMGEPVRIELLARKMIELSGFVPDVDIDIVFTGLRPGEKEYEELLTDDEGVVRTDHDRIWVVEKSIEPDEGRLDIGELIELLDEGDGETLREFAHRNIPGSLLVETSDAGNRSEKSDLAEGKDNRGSR